MVPRCGYRRGGATPTRFFPTQEDLLWLGERIDANLTAGVLTLTIAKKAEAKPRKIALKRAYVCAITRRACRSP